MFWLGVALVIIGLLLLLAEVHVPGFFIAVPGTILLILGIAFLLMGENLDITLALVLMFISAFGATAFTLWFYRTIGKPEPPTTTTPDQLVGKTGIVTAKIIPGTLKGKVRVDSEIWSATADEEIDVGKKVIVKKAEGVHLVVEEVS